ncbi:MAG: DUF4878 domain-containing protein [Deltaproteobacteria bacterium]|nr:MAG: DUF4878 domain-containing protein [Deltaproteobacteria bacterium]
MKRLLAILLLVACTAPQPPPGSAGPAEAVQEFAAALQKGDAATAWSLLSSRTQKEADAAAVEARVVSQTGDSAEVQTADDAGVQVYRVVREGGRWRVDLDLPR